MKNTLQSFFCQIKYSNYLLGDLNIDYTDLKTFERYGKFYSVDIKRRTGLTTKFVPLSIKIDKNFKKNSLECVTVIYRCDWIVYAKKSDAILLKLQTPDINIIIDNIKHFLGNQIEIL